jgi:diadenosine tetraphosphate (Ap4A) HIT family hydrolase
MSINFRRMLSVVGARRFVYSEIDPGQCSVTCTKVSDVPENPAALPDFTRWPSFPFEGDLRIKKLAEPVDVEPPRSGEDPANCIACNTPDDAYIWVSDRWRVRAMDRPTGLPMVLILECRSHLDLGDLPNLLAAELGVMTVRLERAIRSLDGVARVHVNRWGDGSAHLHMWFLARPYGRLQLRGTFLSLWDDILPTIPEQQWRENLALVAAWLAEFGGRVNAEPAHIQWQSPASFSDSPSAMAAEINITRNSSWVPSDPDDVEVTASDAGSTADTPSGTPEAGASEPTAGNAVPRQVDSASSADSMPRPDDVPHADQEPVRP